jgi:hypothetical protein
MARSEPSESALARRSDAITDLALTLPIFLVYHLGVVFLSIRNAADPVTAELQDLAHHSLTMYAVLTLAIGIAFVAVIAAVGRRNPLDPMRFAFLIGEGVVYAMAMRFAGAYAVGSLRLGPPPASTGVFPSIVMSLGAGFYEEIAFRVGLFGIGGWIIGRMVDSPSQRTLTKLAWAGVSAAIFSGWHYVGALGDPFDLRSFVFRAVCGLVLTIIFALRGFAPAVWTHALYDLWAMLL